MFVLEHGTDTITWKVMSGSLIAMTMTAKFEPLADGTRTRVTTSVARGDAPDDLVSPAFRSKGVSHGLFLAALEGELDELTLPTGGSADKCRAIAAGLQADGTGGVGNGAPDERSLANGARTIMQLNAMDMQLRAAGCDPSKTQMGGPINDMIDRIEEKHAREDELFDDEGEQGVRFEPGKPMIDVSRKSDR